MHTIDQAQRSLSRFFGGHRIANQAGGPVLGVRQAVKALIDVLFRWQARADQRRVLRSLPDYMLKDLGISRSDAAFEADKPFWKP